MSTLRLLIATSSVAVATLVVQVLALVTLDATDFGYFSIAYLAGAFTQSVILSVVCEAWVRSDRFDSATPWSTYAAVSAYIAGGGGLLTAAVSFAVPELRGYWWIAAAATSCAGFRLSARFYNLRRGDWTPVLLGDVASAVAALGVSAYLFFGPQANLGNVLGAWAIVSGVSAVFSRLAAPRGPAVVVEWARERYEAIRPLLRESIIMDAAAIGTPYAIASILGVASFGVYRAVSNVAAPVRLVLNPLRPHIATIARTRLTNIRALFLFTCVSILTGILATAGLVVIGRLELDLGTLSDLQEYAIPTGIFVAANLFGHLHYIIARQHASARAIVRARIFQTVVGIMLPLIGALTLGLEGAIWAYSIGTVLSAAVWCVVARRNEN